MHYRKKVDKQILLASSRRKCGLKECETVDAAQVRASRRFLLLLTRTELQDQYDQKVKCSESSEQLERISISVKVFKDVSHVVESSNLLHTSRLYSINTQRQPDTNLHFCASFCLTRIKKKQDLTFSFAN